MVGFRELGRQSLSTSDYSEGQLSPNTSGYPEKGVELPVKLTLKSQRLKVRDSLPSQGVRHSTERDKFSKSAVDLACPVRQDKCRLLARSRPGLSSEAGQVKASGSPVELARVTQRYGTGEVFW